MWLFLEVSLVFFEPEILDIKARGFSLMREIELEVVCLLSLKTNTELNLKPSGGYVHEYLCSMDLSGLC